MFFLVILAQASFAQGFGLTKVVIKDIILKQTIEDFIERTKNEETGDKPNFKEKGFIEVNIQEAKFSNSPKDVVARYIIQDQYHSVKGRLPNYFTYINGKIVLIFNNFDYNLFEYSISEKNKAEIERLLKPYLYETEHVVGRNAAGEVVIDDENFREEFYNLHGGIELIVYGNGEHEILRNGD